jgi:hypothetical protein
MRFFLLGFLAAALFNSRAAWAADTPSGKQPAAQSDAAKYLLQYKFRQGEEVRAKVSHIASVETAIGGTTQTTEMKSYSTKLWRVVAVDASGAMTIENSVESVDLRNKMSGRQEVTYNSQIDKTAPPGYADVAKSIGKVLTVVTIDPAGKVLKREDKEPRAMAGGGTLIPPLPKEPIPISFAWSQPLEVNVTLDAGTTKAIQTRQRYELEKVDFGVATIAVETQVLTPVDDPKIRVQLIQRLTKGHIRFDIATGRILSQRTDLDETVLGFSGADSSMHYVARFDEQLTTAFAKKATADERR